MTYEDIWQKIKRMSQRERRLLAYEITHRGIEVGDYIGLNVHPVSLSNVQPLSDSNVHVYDSVTCVRKGSINFLISV